MFLFKIKDLQAEHKMLVMEAVRDQCSGTRVLSLVSIQQRYASNNAHWLKQQLTRLIALISQGFVVPSHLLDN